MPHMLVVAVLMAMLAGAGRPDTVGSLGIESWPSEAQTAAAAPLSAIEEGQGQLGWDLWGPSSHPGQDSTSQEQQQVLQDIDVHKELSKNVSSQNLNTTWSKPAQEDLAQGDLTQVDPNQEDPTEEGPTQGDPTEGGPTQGDPPEGGPTQGGPTQGDPNQGNQSQRNPTQDLPTHSNPAPELPTQGNPVDNAPTQGNPLDNLYNLPEEIPTQGRVGDSVLPGGDSLLDYILQNSTRNISNTEQAAEFTSTEAYNNTMDFNLTNIMSQVENSSQTFPLSTNFTAGDILKNFPGDDGQYGGEKSREQGVSTSTTHLPLDVRTPPPELIQPDRTGYQPNSIHGLIWEDRRYMIRLLVPVGCGITGALAIVCLVYAFRNCRHMNNQTPVKQATKVKRPPGMDRVMLLADSSDEEI